MSDSDQRLGYRLGDETPPAQRSPRVYEDGSEWFFRTREGAAMGPYPTRAAADQGLRDFIEFIELAPLDTLATLTESLRGTDGEEQPD
jgi:hypothetical protein